MFSIRHLPRSTRAALGLALGLFALSVDAAPLVAVRADNTLIYFDSATPGTITRTVPIAGLAVGENIVGADLRPATRTIFVVTSNARVAEVDANTGALGTRGSYGAPIGGAHGMDFNPTVDRIRFIGADESNLRLAPDTGATAATDTPLSPAGDAVAAAYDRNAAGATVTTLFVIDTTSNQLLRQGGVDGNPSPNGGVLTAIGPLGVDPAGDASFEITAAGSAFAAFNVGGADGLYTINLATGAATLVGTIGNGAGGIVGLAEAPATGTSVPSNATWALMMLGAMLGIVGWLALRRERAPAR